MTPLEKFGLMLKLRGLSQAAAERSAGLPQARIAKWRQAGKFTPTPAQLVNLARLLECEAGWLAVEDGTWPPPGAPLPPGCETAALARAVKPAATPADLNGRVTAIPADCVESVRLHLGLSVTDAIKALIAYAEAAGGGPARGE